MPTPQLVDYTDDEEVAVTCRITPLPDGSRLTVTCPSQIYVFTLTAHVEAESTAGFATETFRAEMAGIVHDFGETFVRRRIECRANLGNPGARFPTYEVELPPERWRDIAPPRQAEAGLLLGRLALALSDGHASLFADVRTRLAELVGTDDLRLTILSASDRLALPTIDPSAPLCTPAPPAVATDGWRSDKAAS